MKNDREQVLKSVSLLHPSDHIVEVRVLGSGKYPQSGYFVDRDHLVNEAVRWSGKANVYITVNPVLSDCAARSLNRIVPAKHGMTTKDAEIVKRTCLFLDFDPVRKSGIASTESEHASAIALARDVRGWLSEQGWPDPLFISSGNGAALFYRIDVPRDDGGLVKRVLKRLAAKFDSTTVHLDSSVHNAARIARLAGTLNMKGENSPERPHRLAQIMEAPEALQLVTTEQLEALVATQTTEPTGTLADAMIERFDVAGWLETRSVAFSVEPSEEGTIFRLAVCPLKGPGHEDGRTWIKQHDDGHITAGCFHAKCSDVTWRKLRRVIDPLFDEEAELYLTGGSLERPTDCHRLARVILDDARTDDGTPTLALHGGQVYRWSGNVWRPVSRGEFTLFVTRGAKAEVDRLAKGARVRGLEGFATNVTKRFVGDVENALTSMIPTVEEQPCWLEGDGPWPAMELLACSDSLVHIPSFVEGRAEYRTALSPRFFTTLNLGYPFNPAGTQPVCWLNFLSQLWPDDPNSIELLQEWVGYLLTLDTTMQKMLLLFGPGGSGKGTILEVIRSLLGKANVASLTLPDLREGHSLEALIGKSLCLFPDASVPARMDKTPIVESIKTITGEDLVSINPKNKPRYSGKLTTRLMVATNDMLDLPDPSNALSRRLLALRLKRTFQDKPDRHLRTKLTAELPGILLWAIEGWRRLQERGQFTESNSGNEIKLSLGETSSPILAFVRECCVVGSEEKVLKDDLFNAWKAWCQETGNHAGTKVTFSQMLMAAIPTIRSYKPRIEKQRLNCYLGIALAEDSGDDIDFSWAFLTPDEADQYVVFVANAIGQLR